MLFLGTVIAARRFFAERLGLCILYIAYNSTISMTFRIEKLARSTAALSLCTRPFYGHH